MDRTRYRHGVSAVRRFRRQGYEGGGRTAETRSRRQQLRHAQVEGTRVSNLRTRAIELSRTLCHVSRHIAGKVQGRLKGAIENERLKVRCPWCEPVCADVQIVVNHHIDDIVHGDRDFSCSEKLAQ